LLKRVSRAREKINDDKNYNNTIFLVNNWISAQGADNFTPRWSQIQHRTEKELIDCAKK